MFNHKRSSLLFTLPIILACLCSPVPLEFVLHHIRYFFPFFSANNTKISIREKEKAVLDQILAKYDARIRPPGINETGE